MHLCDRIFATIRAADLLQRTPSERAAFIRHTAWTLGVAEKFLEMYVDVELRVARRAAARENEDTAPYPAVRRTAA